MYKHYLLLIVSLNMLACANIERVSDDGTPSEADDTQELEYRLGTSPEPSKQDNEDFKRSANPAVVALISQAQGKATSGDFEQAVSLLERALRISPKDPQVHFQLANVHLMQGQANNALQLAFKGKSLVPSSSSAAKAFWKLIGDCYVRLGNTAKASEAYGRI